ncbi:MAG: hypothetical protein Q7R34_03150 [Dehalococcoidia bacterium]|nr:hypothetical protein [Dehalococcoidia bacterium]
MVRKARLGLYLEDEEIKKKIKIAATKRGISTTAYCAEAINERLVRDGEISGKTGGSKQSLLARMDELMGEIGPIGSTTAELVKEGRSRSSRNHSALTELEKGKRLQSLHNLLEGMKDIKGFSKEQAIKALEDAATLVEAFPFESLELSDKDISKLVKIATGLSVTTKGRRQTSVLKEGEPSREVYLQRGVKLNLSWDKKLLSVEIDPKQMAIQARALSIIGIGRGMPSDMAERHDDYLVEAYSER